MKKNKIIHKLNKTAVKIKRASPTILSILSVAGVIGTTVITTKTTMKAAEKIASDREDIGGDEYGYTKFDAVRSAWIYYIPVVAVTGATVSCILMANHLNRKQQASLVSAYVMLERSYQEHKDKVKELFGSDGASWVSEELTRDRYEDDIVPDDGKELFFFEYGPNDGYFQSSREDVISALYHVNRNYQLRGYSPLNELLEFLGLEQVDGGDDIGWCSDRLAVDGYVWVDFFLDKVKLEDGLECTRIDPDLIPELLWGDDYF